MSAAGAGCFHSKHDPVIQDAGAEALIEFQRGLVPAQCDPLETAAAALRADAGNRFEQRASQSASPIWRADIDVLQENTGSPRKRGIGVKIDGIAGTHPVNGGDQRGCRGMSAEEPVTKRCFGGF
jgi:hypothetical protein